MAYVFSKINDQFKQGGNDQKIEKNVGTESVDSSLGQQSMGSQNTASTNPQQFTKSNNTQGAAGAIFQKNLGASQAGTQQALLKPQQSEAAAKTKALQDEANQYTTQNTANPTEGFNQSDLQNVTSDPNAYQNVADFLGKQNKQINPFQTTVNTKINQPSLLQSGNVGGQLQQNRGSGYTRGMGKLDEALFGRSNLLTDTLGKQQALQSGIDTQLAGTSGLGSQLTEKNRAALEQAQGAARGQLGTQQTDILNRINQKLEAQKGKESGEVAGKNAALQENAKKMIQDVLSRPEYANIKNDIQGDFSNFDVNPYITQAAGGDLTAANFTSPEEAAQFQKLSALLGKGDVLQSGEYKQKEGGINEQGLREALQGKVQGASQKILEKRAADKAKQDEINAVVSSNPGVQEWINQGMSPEQAVKQYKEVRSGFQNTATGVDTSAEQATQLAAEDAKKTAAEKLASENYLKQKAQETAKLVPQQPPPAQIRPAGGAATLEPLEAAPPPARGAEAQAVSESLAPWLSQLFQNLNNRVSQDNSDRGITNTRYL